MSHLFFFIKITSLLGRMKSFKRFGRKHPKFRSHLPKIDRTNMVVIWSSSVLVVFHFGRLPFWSSSVLVLFCFSHLPFWSSSVWSSSVLVVFRFGRLLFFCHYPSTSYCLLSIFFYFLKSFISFQILYLFILSFYYFWFSMLPHWNFYCKN